MSYDITTRYRAAADYTHLLVIILDEFVVQSLFLGARAGLHHGGNYRDDMLLKLDATQTFLIGLKSSNHIARNHIDLKMHQPI